MRIASGACSPAEPANVYDRSKPFGPSTRISQFSLSRDPAIDTRQSPRRSANACSMRAVMSLHSRVSLRFCSSIVTPIARNFIAGTATCICPSKPISEPMHAQECARCFAWQSIALWKRKEALGSGRPALWPTKWKRLRHWLCSSHLLLRESLKRGCMYRRSP